MEGALLGLFMISASVFTVLLFHPAFEIPALIPSPFFRRMLMGFAMGTTSVALIYSPWGQQSGAHFNPSVTLTFLGLGKVDRHDACFYVASQFLGGLAGIGISAALFGQYLAHPTVNYVATFPGDGGPLAAFVAELLISLVLMVVLLAVSNTPALARYTGFFAGTMVALYITFEAPVSGMSMNPARSFGPAFLGRIWTDYWVYLTAPPLGMLAAGLIYTRVGGPARIACAKLHHENDRRCIFRCEYGAASSGRHAA